LRRRQVVSGSRCLWKSLEPFLCRLIAASAGILIMICSSLKEEEASGFKSLVPLCYRESGQTVWSAGRHVCRERPCERQVFYTQQPGRTSGISLYQSRKKEPIYLKQNNNTVEYTASDAVSLCRVVVEKRVPVYCSQRLLASTPTIPTKSRHPRTMLLLRFSSPPAAHPTHSTPRRTRAGAVP